MEKTIKEWLSELPEGIREKALNNADTGMLDMFSASAHEALSVAFIWESSPEGTHYWKSVHSTIFTGNPFPDELTALRKENQEARELLKEAKESVNEAADFELADRISFFLSK